MGGAERGVQLRHGSRPALLRQSFLSSWLPLLYLCGVPYVAPNQSRLETRVPKDTNQRLPERNRNEHDMCVRVVAPWPYGVGKSVVLGPSAPSRARSQCQCDGRAV